MGLALVLFCAAMAGMSGFLFGHDSGIMTTTIAQEQFLLKFSPSSATLGTIVAIMQAGGFFGCLAAGKTSDFWGRKRATMFGCVFILIGGALQAAAAHVAMLIVGRLITGFGVGFLAITVPVYQAEIAPPHLRGTVMGCQQLMLTIGGACANWTGYGCSFVDTSFQWRMPLALQVVPGLILLFGACFLPESPRWLAKQGAWELALQVVQRLHVDGPNLNSAQYEFQEIVDQIRKDEAQASERRHLQIFQRKTWRKRLFLGAGIWLMLNLTGINSINYYMTSFINALGYTGKTTLVLTGIYGCVGAATTFLFLFVVHRLSRKRPLIIANMLMAATLAVLAALTGASSLGQGGKKGGLAMLFLFLIIYSSSYGPLAWVYPAEIFPTEIRAVAYSISSAVNWLTQILLNQVTPVAMARIEWRYYFLFVAANIVSAGALLLLYPETNGKSLEQMDELFGDHGDYEEHHGLTPEQYETRQIN